MNEKKTNFLTVLIFIFIFAFIWSGIKPYHFQVWILEVFPAFFGFFLLLFTYKKFRLTNLTYFFLFLHALLLIVGGHYTYARVPAFDWIRETFELSRNHYDRLGHFTQGFVPALLTREILLRSSPLKQGKWLFFLVTCVCLAFSAFYEFLEWWVAILTKTAAEDFLATQGDIWDTQWDMFLALIGAITAQLLFRKIQDRQLKKLL